MAKSSSLNFDTLTLIAPLLLILYLCIGFIPNWQAVDKIAPQWLAMSIINLLSFVYFIFNRKNISSKLTLNIKASLTLTYIGFILWAVGSVIYSINPTEVIVNIARQFNVFLMFFSMAILITGLKNKLRFLPWLITLILGIEVYAVISEAIEMINNTGIIKSGNLKGITANRNITAFSLAIKIPFVLYLIYLENKISLKIILATLICAVLISLTMIESRASFLAVGFTTIAFLIMQIILYLKVNRKFSQLLNVGYLIIPLSMAIFVNQTFLSTKGADVLSRAATISVSTDDGSVNQRLRYYEDVLTHMTSNPILGVGLGNWKLKSIDYDAKDIDGYIVPYHAHSDFIQLGAELGLIGFFFYLSIFVWALIYTYRLIRFAKISVNEKIFLFLVITSLGVYSIDANLNFPIARPQVLVVWTLILAIITFYYQKYQNNTQKLRANHKMNYVFLLLATLFLLPSIYINNMVYKSLKAQMFLLQDFNSNQFNLNFNQLDQIVPDIPNITVTTIPINSIKARYFLNAKRYDKALELLQKGTKANPYLYYSEILKSQIFQEKGQLDSAKFYAQKAFLGLPNNDLHATRYVNLLNITRDREGLEEAFGLLTAKKKFNNWKNYLIVANSLYPPKDKALIKKAKKATNIFPNNEEIKALYLQIALGQSQMQAAASFSSKALEYYNAQDYLNAALNFEKAFKSNPLEYSYFENAATSNYQIGNIEKALEQINIVVNDLNPLDGKCEYIKALIFIRMGDPIGACPLLATSRDSGFSQAESTFDQYCR